MRVWLVEGACGRLARKLGCRPLLPWRKSLPLEQQVITAGGYGLLHAPGILAGNSALAASVRTGRGCDILLFDGGRFSLSQAPLVPETEQTVVVRLSGQDAEVGHALVKALQAAQSPSRLLLLGWRMRWRVTSVSQIGRWKGWRRGDLVLNWQQKTGNLK